MNRDIWKSKSLDENYQCPHCKKGYLKIGDYNEIQTLQSKRDDEEIQHDGMEAGSNVQYYYFWAYLNCNKCSETVLCSGESSDSIYFDGNDDEPSKFELMIPKIFMPTLEIISVPPKTPDKLKEEIYKSFELFWINESSCANSIRKVLEYFMDEQGIPRTDINKKEEEYRLGLHKRLDKFKKVNSKLLIAVKYIGNAGSHSDTTIDYILDGYELLEYVLNLIYADKQTEYLKIANRIIEELKDK